MHKTIHNLIVTTVTKKRQDNNKQIEVKTVKIR